jgi:hypothetical protein
MSHAMASATGMGHVLEPLGTGQWRVKTGIYRPPMLALGVDDIRSGPPVNVVFANERSRTANTIKGRLYSPLNFDQASDFPAVTDPKYVEEDGGETLVEDLTLPATNSKEMARRISKSC